MDQTAKISLRRTLKPPVNHEKGAGGGRLACPHRRGFDWLDLVSAVQHDVTASADDALQVLLDNHPVLFAHAAHSADWWANRTRASGLTPLGMR